VVTKYLLIKKEGQVIFEQEASRNAPQVKVISPTGGEIMKSGVHKIVWEASDADGDPLSFLVQFSPDGGQTWEGVTIRRPGNPLEAELRVEEYPASRAGIIRVTASDGLNTTFDLSDGYFSLGPIPNVLPTPRGPIGPK
jgi:hypothetical protein